MAASCVLVTNPSSSGPTLTLHNIDSSNGTGSPAGVVFFEKKKKKTQIGFQVGFYCERFLRDIRSLTRRPQCGVITRTEGGGLRAVIPGSGCTPTFPPRRSMFPRPWDVFIPVLGGGVPLPLHQDRMLVSALLPPPPPSSFPALLHLCLYLSLLLKMLSPSPVPQGSTWWRNKGEGNGGKRWK